MINSNIADSKNSPSHSSVLRENQKPIKWEKVYVFISSTFNDMHAERDYLVKKVFPQLQEWCEKRRLRLVDIDLRWGVTEQDAIFNKNVVKVCLDHINTCRPFFLCFLGQRRGWVPEEKNISEDTFQDFPDLKHNVGNSSITELEILHALISPMHQSKEHDPGKPEEYYEKAKHAFFYLRDPSYLIDLPKDPKKLRETYTNEGIEDANQRATADRELEEWRKVKIKKLNRPIHHYTAKWNPQASTPEISIPLECPSTAQVSIERWQREWQKAGINVECETLENNPQEVEKAKAFNEKLCSGRLTDFRVSNEQLSNIILEDLKAAIIARYPKHNETKNYLLRRELIGPEVRKAIEQNEDLQKELDQQEQFHFLNSEGFIERQGDFTDLDNYVNGDSNKLFVLTAHGGMGKSMLLANWIDHYNSVREIRQQKNQTLHYRFIGASDKSTTIYSLLSLLLQEIKEIAHKLDDPIPIDPKNLFQDLPKLLETIGKHGKTVIIIDALNQLESGLTGLNWLPWSLPPNVKMIVSFKRGESAAEELYSRLQSNNIVMLSEVRPFENLEDKDKLVRAYLSQFLKDIDEKHLRMLTQSPGSNNPLYLKIVLSELRVFGAFSNLEKKICDDFGQTPVSAFKGLLERLETDPTYSVIDPKQSVPLLFGLISHARHGLSAQELISIFIQALKLANTIEQRGIVADEVYLLLRQVRPFLTHRDGRFDLFYESLKIAAQEKYVTRIEKTKLPRMPPEEWHCILAKYFESLPNWEKKDLEADHVASRFPMLRKVSELPYHLTLGHMWHQLETTLTDLDFIEAKCVAKMVYDLIVDYDRAKENLKDWVMNDKVLDFADFVKFQSLILIKNPHLVIQQAVNQPNISAPFLVAQRLINSGKIVQPLFKWINKPQGKSAQIITLSGHTRDVTGCAWSPDGQQILSASGDGTLKIWDAKTGKELRTLTGHIRNVTGCAWSPDGQQILSASRDKTLRVWDAKTGRELHTFLTGNTGWDKACAWSPNGQQIISVGLLTLKIWDVKTGKELRTLTGHKDWVNACAWSPDGQQILSASGDGTLKVWDAKTGKELRTLTGNTLTSKACAWSPDGQQIISQSKDKTLKIWDAKTGKELRTLTGHTTNLVECTWSPDGQQILLTSKNKTLKIWDAKTGKELCTLKGNTGDLVGCAWSPDGQTVLSASGNGTLKVWDARTGKELYVLLGSTTNLVGCAWSPDGQQILSASFGGRLNIWDGRTGKQLHLLTGHTRTVTRCSWSPDGQKILSRSDDGVLKVWDAKTGKELRTILTGHTGWIKACAWSPDGQQIISQSKDKTLKIWDAKTGKELRTLTGNTLTSKACAWSPNSKQLISASRDKQLKIWNTYPKTDIIRTLTGHIEWVNARATSPDYQQIITASHDGTLKIWDAKTGKELRTLTGHIRNVTGCAWSPDGQTVLSASKDCTLKVWDAKTGKECCTLSGHTRTVTGCVWSPDCQKILSRSDDGVLKVWDAKTGKELCTLKEHTNNAESCVWSPDCQKILSRSDDGVLKVWDAKTGRELRTILTGHTGWVKACAWSPDGQQILSESDDKTLKVWDTKTGRELRTILTGNTDDSVKAYAWSPNGQQILSTSHDGTLKVWDVRTGKELYTLKGHTRGVWACAWSPDGQQIISTSYDKTLKVWDTKTGVDLATFTHPSVDIITSFMVKSNGELRICAGDLKGTALFLQLFNLGLGSPFVQLDSLSNFDKQKLEKDLHITSRVVSDHASQILSKKIQKGPSKLEKKSRWKKLFKRR